MSLLSNFNGRARAREREREREREKEREREQESASERLSERENDRYSRPSTIANKRERAGKSSIERARTMRVNFFLLV
jgi:hypothetical protein